LEKEAEKLAKETVALEQEANLRKTLGESFSTAKSGLKEGEELSNDQLIAIMADAVGASSDAQGKLILSKVSGMMTESNTELQKTQKLLIELAASVSMNQARSEDPDFDDYKTEVAGIMSTTRGLSPSDALMLAKAKRAKNQPKQKQTETERPNQIPLPSADTSSRDEYVQSKQEPKVQQSPKAAFKAAVDAAYKKVQAARQG
jgi:hypothetical protein